MKDRDRENKTGRYTSDEDAAARPGETTSEAVKLDPLKKWIKRLQNKGGKIIFCPDVNACVETIEAYGVTLAYIEEEKLDGLKPDRKTF